MTNVKSALVLKNVAYVPDHDDHERMLEELGIEDTLFNLSKMFVKVEYSPEDYDITSDFETWSLKINQEIVPDWWDESIYYDKVKAAVKQWYDKHFIHEGKKTVYEGTWYAFGETEIAALETATVFAFDRSTIRANNHSSVNSYNNAKIIAYDYVSVVACGNSNVIAFEDTTIEAYDNSIVEADDYSLIRAYDKSIVNSYKNSVVIAEGFSNVFANGQSIVKARNDARVTAKNESTVILGDEFYINHAVVEAFDKALVVRNTSYGKVELHDNSICVNKGKRECAQ